MPSVRLLLMKFVKLTFVCALSWLIGVIVYFASLAIIYGQTAHGADLIAVLFWTAIAAMLAFPLIYLPLMLLLRRLLRGYKPVFLFPIAASLFFVVPTAFIVAMFSTTGTGFLRSLLSAESLLFYCMFVAVGVTFGLGFVWSFRTDAI